MLKSFGNSRFSHFRNTQRFEGISSDGYCQTYVEFTSVLLGAAVSATTVPGNESHFIPVMQLPAFDPNPFMYHKYFNHKHEMLSP